MPTRTVDVSLESAAPITWPSLSDLASALYGHVRGLDTLGREVRRLRVKTRKIGRELRVEPRGAVRVLEARGVTARQAMELVARSVRTRTREVPTLDAKATTVSRTRRDPYAAMGSALTAELQSYERRMFGVSVTTLLPSDVPTDLTSADDLVRAVGGPA